MPYTSLSIRTGNTQALFVIIILLSIMSIVFVLSFYNFAHSSSLFLFCTTTPSNFCTLSQRLLTFALFYYRINHMAAICVFICIFFQYRINHTKDPIIITKHNILSILYNIFLFISFSHPFQILNIINYYTDFVLYLK